MSEITHEKLIHTLTFHGFRRVTIDPKEKYGEFQLSTNSDIESLNILIRDTFYEGFSSGD